ncbi:MAG TPA: thiamine pyrophosphate-dependent dehydrogenase E1 component subunit alpha [Desulfuromonadales bacterium]|nr:thiamine pyrophosphate-dependent dehydrogenase E1 component subunit alpha [Desulfuromonadales bacterium]
MGIKHYGKAKVLHFYREMVRIRQFELKAAELFMQGLMSGNIHTCAGQEATAVGACQALRPTDFTAATHRGHGHCLAKGAEPSIMMAELFGKANGYCKGKGGSMHIVDMKIGMLGANGIVGAGIPIATGSALASKIRKTDEVTLAFFGDAASNQGTFHEAINMASAWHLPAIFLCENNQYGVSVCIDRVCNVENISDRACAYNIPGVLVDGNDVFAVYEAVKTATERARQGEGPTLIEAKTYRHRGHYEGDPQIYKSQEEIDRWKAKDPIDHLRAEILKARMAKTAELDSIDAEAAVEIEKAVEFAKNSPYPEAGEVLSDVFASDNERSVTR